jgi:hypothetical protein
MADDKVTNSTVGEKATGTGIKPDTTPDATRDINPGNDERSLDIGESG